MNTKNIVLLGTKNHLCRSYFVFGGVPSEGLWIKRLVLVVSSSVLQSLKSSLTAVLTGGSAKTILFGYLGFVLLVVLHKEG